MEIQKGSQGKAVATPAMAFRKRYHKETDGKVPRVGTGDESVKIMRTLKFCSYAMFAAVVSSPSLAEPMDWRFCVATDFDHRIAYVSSLFESGASASAVGAVVSNLLKEKDLPVENIQCPVPQDRRTSEDKHRVAETFLKTLGYRVVPAP
jgi:hypothetical protein